MAEVDLVLSASSRPHPTTRLAAIVLATCLGCLAAVAAAQDHADHSAHEMALQKPTHEVSLGRMSIPDAELLDQDGNRLHFYRDLIEDRVVAINFIFTTCTTICPPMGANFSRLQKLMGERVGRDFEMISVSVDPAVDTPARLKAWSRKFGAQPGWTLVTGPKPDVDRVLKALKVFTPDKTDHSPIVLVGNDARGEWTRTYGLAPAGDLGQLIDRMIHDDGSDPAEGESR